MTAPFARVDHVVIAVRDLAAAERDYVILLGRSPSSRAAHPALGTRNVIFGLANCYLELLALDGDAPVHPVGYALRELLSRTPEGLFAVALGSDALAATAATLRAAGVTVGEPTELRVVAAEGERRPSILPIAADGTRGVNVFAIAQDARTIPAAPPAGDERAMVTALDHVVLFTDDLEAALRLWRDAFGIPERWRREFPARGTVNVGLRLGGVTLEVVAPLGGASGDRGERLWGLAYTVADCAAAVTRVRSCGMSAGDARPGLAPATHVATIKRPDGVPTLLIEHTR